MLVQKVLVVGAGIGGLGAAALLARRGVQVEVIEARPDSSVLGVGINQPANSLRALATIGVLDECLNAGYAHSGNTFFDWHGNLIVDCPSRLGGDDVPANSALSRAELKRILLRAAETAQVKIRYGVTVEDLTDEGDRVLVHSSDGARDFYDLVIGFDGAKSTMRELVAGPGHDPVFSGYGVWRKTMPRDPSVSNTLLFQGDRTKAGVIPLSEDSMYLFLVTPEPGNPRHDRADFGTLLTARLAGYEGLIGDLRDAIDGPDGIVYSPLSEVLLPAPWNRGRLIVLGDAAHMCAPHLTQGAGMALEDAVVLAEELGRGTDLDEAMTAFTARRYQRVKLVHDASHAILAGEMAIDAASIPAACAHMREALPAQTAAVEDALNQPF
ncbi:2-polyprenyl-6-methoxyphenol hydroxylase [Rhodococcus sp. WB9]|uniref:FAD-dependent monooxygenase n=1 Tax=Rhodococcus sp. WB9 TaxID=2594007 RepID=UPI00118582B8|nr:FAD-dependent monooxygenase [Rhodococcus sp. WB9]QDQ95374.1 2-polyprenyl-6-methoxyphenol hydroxylase [Rhodococcus sp. WB9]